MSGTTAVRAARFGEGDGGIPPSRLEEPLWYALRTRARAEKRVASRLKERKTPALAAVARVERRWSDRKTRVGMPLFPGYVFARFPLRELVPVLGTLGVVAVVRSGGLPSRVPEEEIASVRALVQGVSETGALPRPTDYLEPGRPVTVVRGPFEGMRGILLERRGRGRVAVRLPAIRQAVAVELNLAALRPAREEELRATEQDRRLRAR